MDESKLIIDIKETANGWLVTFTRWDESVEYVFTRPSTAAGYVRKVMVGTADPFPEGTKDNFNGAAL